ncbi:MAG: hypothetical protein JW795_16725, partial [Chitinivibrionales bacterium]|nr:hypothetical protein [Chitinivibrionales bacterium]
NFYKFIYSLCQKYFIKRKKVSHEPQISQARLLKMNDKSNGATYFNENLSNLKTRILWSNDEIQAKKSGDHTAG